jgi:Tol biopolymer transport system component
VPPYNIPQYDIFAYDLVNGETISVASDPLLIERNPSTSGPWVAYAVSSFATASVYAIHAINLDTGETRIIADYGVATYPVSKIDGNLISYESNVSGNWDVYVYRIAEGLYLTFRR